jgi:hypothetical protein
VHLSTGQVFLLHLHVELFLNSISKWLHISQSRHPADSIANHQGSSNNLIGDYHMKNFRRSQMLKRASILAWLLCMALAGHFLGSAAGSRYFAQELQYRPISKPSKSRMAMGFTETNNYPAGILVVEGALRIGVAETVVEEANQMAVFIRLTSKDDGTVVDEQIGRFDVPAKLGGIEYPVHRVYEVPSGLYKVELLGFDLGRPIRKEDGTPEHHVGVTYWLFVN